MKAQRFSIFTPKSALSLVAAATGIVLASGGGENISAQEPGKVRVWIEKSTGPSGPWEEVDLSTVEKDPAGNPVLSADGQQFFRTRIERFDGTQTGPVVLPLAEVPKFHLDLVQSFLKGALDAEGADDGGEWPEDAELAPFVRQLDEVSGDGGTLPGYLEFKVVRPADRGDKGEGIADDPSDGLGDELGYILVSLSDTDFPIAEFATSGPTACEELLKRAKGKGVRFVRFGPTFAVAEDEAGEPAATMGAAPFQVDPLVLDTDGFEWKGDDQRGTDTGPRETPDFRAVGYRSYAEFKKSFGSDETYKSYREVRAARAKVEWDALRGKGQSLTIALGRSETAFPRLFGRQGGEFLLVTDMPGFLTVEEQATGGLLLTPKSEGEGLLRVRSAAGEEEALFVIAISPRAPRDLGDVLEQKWFYAGNWESQPKYHQTSNSDWCNKVGCGPVAWAMLFAWFDRNWGVEHAFRGEPNGQLPPVDTTTASRKAAVFAAYDELHDACDVICPPFSDQGATYPTDMTDGMKGYTWAMAQGKFINRSWQTNSITGTWPDAGALRCRDAIKDGYPAVVGLGWLWHYALAYGYSYKKIEGPAGYTLVQRYLKCNMGWGTGTDPRWYNMLDTFYAANVRITKGQNAP